MGVDSIGNGWLSVDATVAELDVISSPLKLVVSNCTLMVGTGTSTPIGLLGNMSSDKPGILMRLATLL